MNIDQARSLMHEWVASESLRGHMEAVAACMAHHAQDAAPEEVERWTVAGLLHDFDYERHPTPAEHPFVGVEHLRAAGVDAEILEAILGHAEYSGVPRTTAMAKHLFACDELAGFIVAVAKVRPNGIADLEAKSVRKKLKDKAFAAAVSREDIARGVEELGADPSEHIARCIEAIRGASGRVGV
ncbi:MAG: HD domain-containing protein [Phycisphaerales bacterium]|jgi:predicted hydrolase (HD superfamily)